MKCCAAIIVAAGSSRRAGFDKLLAPLHGVKVLERSIRAFASCREITEIVVVCPEERFHAINGADLETEIPVTRVDGGAERHESVQNGLAALLYTPEFVAVHDGARPLITVEQISRCIQTAREYGAAASAHPVTDTLKTLYDSGTGGTGRPVVHGNPAGLPIPSSAGRLCGSHGTEYPGNG